MVFSCWHTRDWKEACTTTRNKILLFDEDCSPPGVPFPSFDVRTPEFFCVLLLSTPQLSSKTLPSSSGAQRTNSVCKQGGHRSARKSSKEINSIGA